VTVEILMPQCRRARAAIKGERRPLVFLALRAAREPSVFYDATEARSVAGTWGEGWREDCHDQAVLHAGECHCLVQARYADALDFQPCIEFAKMEVGQIAAAVRESKDLGLIGPSDLECIERVCPVGFQL
jgi:hypothetical protein